MEPTSTREPQAAPTSGEWTTSVPEAQGMSSARLVEMMEALHERGIVLDSLTILRNGRVVADFYPNPMFPPNHLHIINSCAKSVVSVLVGIAIDQGHLSSVQDRVVDLLGVSGADLDARWSRLTLQHLLTMQTGLRSRDSFLYRWEGLFSMMASRDWLAHVLTLPFDAEPGTRFDYSNISTYLLSAILTKATGTDTLAFATQHLFEPLGIEGVRWETDPDGVYVGFARMWMLPHDLAKLGLLFLQHGRWGGRQIVSESWVKESLRPHARPRRYVYHRKADGRPDFVTSGGFWLFTNFFRPFSTGYGYQWWLGPRGTYAAIGVNGQFVMVAPEQDVVVAATNKFEGREAMLPAMLLTKHILPAVVSDEALPDDPESYGALKRWFTPPPVEEEVYEVHLPGLAQEVSGRAFRSTANPWTYDDLTFTFSDDPPTAWISFTREGAPVRIEAGLEGRRRYTVAGDDRYAARARWIDATALQVEFEIIGYSSPTVWDITFEDADHAEVEERSVIGTNVYALRA
ncbi:MAG: serine hydrolase [Myxococcota bacterium]